MMGAFDFLNKTPGQLAKEAALKGAKKAGGAAKDAASKRLAGTHNVHYPCGGKGKHINGCDGDCHETLADSKGEIPVGKHSREIHMTKEQYERFKKDGGSAISASRAKGGFMVHVSKFPKHWKP
jgi:hypothetical protein